MNKLRLTKEQVEEAISNLDQSLPKGEARVAALMEELLRRFGANGFSEDGASAFERWTCAGQYHTAV